jgi:hypothetical protein
MPAILNSRSPVRAGLGFHPHYGPIKAGDMLFDWAGHDLLNIRQIGKRLHEY